MPTQKVYIRPGETVVFTMSHVSDELTTFVIDYKDGTLCRTTDNVFGHSWTNPDTYQVNVTAVSRTSTETKFIEVSNPL